MTEFKKLPMVYIACQYTNGDIEKNKELIEANVMICMNAVEELMNSGRFVPYMTLLSHYYQKNHYSHDWETWMKYSFQILSHCDILLRLPGTSKGADQEVEFAKQNNIPVYYSIEELINETCMA